MIFQPFASSSKHPSLWHIGSEGWYRSISNSSKESQRLLIETLSFFFPLGFQIISENLHEDCDFNDVALKYISQILMEEDMEEKTCMLQESLALEATEKSFYNVIGENYPPSIDHHRASSIDEIHEDQYENNCSNGFVDEPKSILEIPNIFSGSESSSQFRRGAEEARKFLPNGNGLFDMGFKVEKKHPNEHFAEGSRGKRNSHPEDLDAEEDRNTKLSAIFDELTVRSEMLDQVLLCDACQSKRSNLGKSRGRKKGGKKDVVDLSNLLTLCAQAVVAGNQRSANDQLKLIRQHASPMGDGMQRMAYYFVNGLEARLRGSGTEIYKGKLLNFFSNTTIRKLAEKAESLHIIDFGILYAERVQETGRRLANYAKSFNVPFEFNAIAQKWETIQVEDLKIDTEDVLVVNCHCRFRNLLDETVTVESPRDTVLNLIRKLNPVVFIQGIVNGGYGAPFFRTRFREALFHYSALFDMLEHIVPRERLERTDREARELQAVSVSQHESWVYAASSGRGDCQQSKGEAEVVLSQGLYTLRRRPVVATRVEGKNAFCNLFLEACLIISIFNIPDEWRPTDLVYNCNWESENRARIVNENCWFTQQEHESEKRKYQEGNNHSTDRGTKNHHLTREVSYTETSSQKYAITLGCYNHHIATLPSSFSSSSSANMVPNIFNDSESVLQFRRGFEEASKFLPNGNGLLLDLANHHTGLLSPEEMEAKHFYTCHCECGLRFPLLYDTIPKGSLPLFCFMVSGCDKGGRDVLLMPCLLGSQLIKYTFISTYEWLRSLDSPCRMLMEEDVEERNCMFQESLALEATEKLFYDIIREKYLPPDDHQTAPFIEENSGNSDQNGSIDFSTYSRNATSDGNCVELGRNFDVGEYKSPHVAPQPTCQSSFSSSSSAKRVPNIFNDSPNNVVDKVKKKHADEYFRDGWRGKKKSHPWDLESKEERSSKQAAFYNGITVTSEMFDRVLLCGPEEDEDALRETWQNETTKTLQQDGQSKGSGKSHGRTKGGKKDLVDFRSLLTLCAQAVAADDRTSANKQLRQIRQHASSMGDGMQRLAHYFANSLEARLSGSGAQMYKAITTKPSAANVLKIYHLLIVVSPFVKVTNFFSNKSIAEVAEKSERLHVIDFGILYGFSWPSLIQRLSSRPGGPPKLRITGIDLPEPGFRPAERLEETGRRLADYAKCFNVPFEFNALAQKFETVQIEDLKLDNDEVLAVRSRYRFGNLPDETVVAESPRDSNARPETYKQWQVRNERIGFRQLPLDREVVEEAKEWVKSCLHKDFIIDEDGQWLRLGWKGRITHAMSSWKPAC
ncbi:unnamed protein product, partial [Vitis vinifera]